MKEAGQRQLAELELQAHIEVDGIQGAWIPAGVCLSVSGGALAYLTRRSFNAENCAVVNKIISFHE
jgi:hypothetical protein